MVLYLSADERPPIDRKNIASQIASAWGTPSLGSIESLLQAPMVGNINKEKWLSWSKAPHCKCGLIEFARSNRAFSIRQGTYGIPHAVSKDIPIPWLRCCGISTCRRYLWYPQNSYLLNIVGYRVPQVTLSSHLLFGSISIKKLIARGYPPQGQLYQRYKKEWGAIF